MPLSTPSRFARSTAHALVLAVYCVVPTISSAQPQTRSNLRPPAAKSSKPQQEHLAQWMDRHRSLPLSQQQSALEHEPGFQSLPAETQQRMRDRLTQLNAMPAEQRQRLLERTEAMEQLSPIQRQQIRGAMQQLSSLPPDRRRLVARAFRDMREMPVPERQAVLGSDRFRGQFSEGERATLSNLLTVEPYLPLKRSSDNPEP